MFAMPWLVAAVSLTLQQPAAPAPATPPTPAPAPTRAARSHRGLGAQLDAASAALQSASADLASLTGLSGMSGLSGLTGLSGLSGLSSLEGLSSLSSLAGLESLNGDFSDAAELAGDPPPAWADQDPGDSLYRSARQLLNNNRYADAANAFANLIKHYPRSDYTPDAYYWQAFALYSSTRQATMPTIDSHARYSRARRRNSLVRRHAETPMRCSPRCKENWRSGETRKG